MIEQVKIYKTNFCDLFHYAEEHFGIGWNAANDLFFSSDFITYKGYHFILAEDWPDEYTEGLSDWEKACYITRHFFKDNGIPDFTEVLMDCG